MDLITSTMTEDPREVQRTQLRTPRICFHLGAETWNDWCRDVIENHRHRLTNFTRSCIIFAAVFTMGVTIRGEWLLNWKFNFTLNSTVIISGGSADLLSLNLEDYHLQGLGYYWLWITSTSFLVYVISGGLLHWHFYVRQRERASDWKCQPTKFMSFEYELHEIIMGSISLLLISSVSGIVVCYVMNGGKCTIYFNVGDYGWIWFFASIPIIFIWQDYLTYWLHRLNHHPFLYRHVHKVHHKYKQPTAFSVTAFHPIEICSLQAILFSPMALFPVHWVVFVGSLIYNYYHGIIDHSGVNFKAGWWEPWQPGVTFHDNHHQYTHGNFGVNCKYWDKIHGTEQKRRKKSTHEMSKKND